MEKITKNIASLGLVQMANYLIPLILIPIIVRILGAEAFGRISYAQNIISYLTLVVTFGFEYSATRQIALAPTQDAKRRVFWSVMIIKALLLLVSTILLLTLPLYLERAATDMRLYVYTALTNIGFVLFPTWYLQGEENMGRMAMTNFTIKLLGAILILAIIHSAAQYRLYPLLLSVANIVGGLWALVYVMRKYEIGSIVWDAATLRACWREGLPIFINNVFVSLYNAANLTILGLFVGDAEIGYFSGAQRLIIAVNMCVVMPVSTSFFPRVSQLMAENRHEGIHYLRRVMLYACLAAALVSVVTAVAAPLVVRLMLGAEFEASIALLRLMSPLPLLIMTATLLTVQGLYGQGRQRIAPLVGATVATLCVGLNLWLIPAIGVSGAVWSWLAAQAAEVLIVGGYLLYKRQI